jgi:prefoldin alpha subunit
MNEAIFKEKYLEFTKLEKRMQEIQNQLEQTNEQYHEIKYIIDSFDEVKTLKKGDDLLVPIFNGIFLKAKLTEDAKDLLINIGENTVVHKTIPDTIKMFEEQAKEIKQTQTQLATRFMEIEDKLIKNETEIKTLLEKYQAKE